MNLLFLIFTISASISSAQSTYCADIFSASQSPTTYLPNSAIGDRSESIYVPSGLVHELKKISPQNQCRTSECYLFSYVGMIEVANQNILNRAESPRISAPYLFVKKMLEWSQLRAWNPEQKLSFSFKGGFFWDPLNLTRKYGLVPHESWQPKVAFENWDFAQLYNDIEKISARQSKIIRGNFFVNLFIKNSKELQEKRYQEALPLLHEVLEKWTGPLPESFDYRGQVLQAKDIERTYGIDHRTRIEMMYPRGRLTYGPHQIENGFQSAVSAYGGGWKVSAESFAVIEQKAMTWLDKGAPIMTELFWGDRGSHAMIIVGYESKNGVIERWKLKNSWGDKWSDEGSAWYTAEDLRKNLRAAYFVGWEPPSNETTPIQ